MGWDSVHYTREGGGVVLWMRVECPGRGGRVSGSFQAAPDAYADAVDVCSWTHINESSTPRCLFTGG